MDTPSPRPMDSLPDVDERRLVSGLRAREPQAFEQLVRAYGGYMLAVARRFLFNEEDARQAVQDAFLAAFRSFATFDERASLGPWLHRIAINSALDKLRGKRRHPERSIDDWLPSFEENGQRLEPQAEWSETAEAALNRRETGA